MKKLTILSLCFLLYSMILKGQLFAPDFSINTINPPELYLHGVERIAILNFEDESSATGSYWNPKFAYGAKVADYMTNELIMEDRGIRSQGKTYISGFNTRIYTVIERTKLDEVLKEQNLGISGSIEESQAVKIGKLLGLDAIILGSISHLVDEGTYSKKFKNKDGSIYYKYYARRELKAEARMKIISVQSGEIIGMTTKSAVKESEVSADGPISVNAAMSEEELANKAYHDVSSQLVSYFTPHYVNLKLNIERIKAKEYKAQGKEIERFIIDNRIDKALLATKELYEADPYNAKITNNMGVLYEGTGNFEQALEAYSLALELDPENTAAQEAINRLNGTIQLVDYLAGLGMEITPYTFQTEGSAVADRVTTRGQKKDRVNVHTEMDELSSIAAKVPGDTQFEIIEDAGEWYLIKLLGGKQGYLSKVNTK